jgi:O-antigen/teichoic acid export membrane protein
MSIIFSGACFITLLIAKLMSHITFVKLLTIRPDSDILKEAEQKNNIDFLIVNVMTILLSQGVLFVIAVNINIIDYALIGVALKLTSMVTFACVSILVLFTPSFSELHASEKHSEFKRTVRKGGRIIAVSGTIPLVILTLLSNQILSLYGEEFQQATPYLLILSLAIFINSLTLVSTNVLSMTGFQKNIKYIFVFTVSISLPLTFFVSLYFGSLGATLALAFSLCFQNVASFLLFKRKFGYFPI